jgi:antibiotic biosynthesis monooxygenase (ABM) superfamily enzyme
VTTISPNEDVVTLINVFTVEPEKQQELIDVLIGATEQVMSKLPGYVSANIHRSLDGTKVTNYAQWRRREDFEAIFDNVEAAKHMRHAAELAASFEPSLYQVVFCDHTPAEGVT